MKVLILLLSFTLFISCIPIRIAPKIKDHKITKGKRFKRGLPKKNMFIFEDPKNENEFYNYINTKFQLQDYYVDVEVPFEIENEKYYFSFYEVEIPTKTINLLPLMVDGVLSQTTDMDLILEDAYASRKGNWYIAIEVFNNSEKDCLHEDSKFRIKVLPYLGQLKKEYMNTVNYNEVVFKN
ncbi:hypothetical protein HME9304_01520 [Flagellimonas maritima]|uniref:Lipoprotein n=1 Tax=Flagellimonas maritima TaxID=1383885 RepID=A0A2Z4LTA6_9FLAO|nr:hypothetical protein [Allomuricauda aurantiaca]AWX44517.1 hypothetical protein HME9304_01520 [Allomuricauda aurantiaca]